MEVLIEKIPLGTAGSLRLLKNKIKNFFLLINGDSFADFNFLNFNHLNKKFIGKMLIVDNKNYKEVKEMSTINLKNKRVFFDPKSNKINAGVYLFSKKIFKVIKNKTFSLEKEVLPKLINKNLIQGVYTNKYFVDIGTKKNLNFAKKTILKIFQKPAIFLDRDGVLNHDYGHVGNYKSFKWKKGSIKALKYLNKKKNYIFIITNQSGIARGFYSESDFLNLQRKIKKVLEKKNIFIDDVLYCPHHPYEGKGVYKVKCKCRKPDNLLIKKTFLKWPLLKKKTFMIGDQKTDFLCAKKSKIKYYNVDFNLYNQVKKILN